MKKILFLLLVSLFLFEGCSNPPKEKLIKPSDVNFMAEYDKNFDHIIYPSLILGLANYSGERESDFFTFKLRSPQDNATLRIKVEKTPLNFETIFQAQLGLKGTEHTFSPLIKWNYQQLKEINQQGNVDFTFSCYINDEEVDIKNIRLNYRSVNECVLGIYDTNNKYIDYKWMFAAYVNEEHPWIDNLLKDILKNKIVDRYVGYLGTPNDVLDQVFAVWYFLQEKEVKYSSITNTSSASKKVFAQYIRFFDQVYLNQQANCVDGCVFLSSILKRIGLYPFLVSEPAHMYLGFYQDKSKQKIYLLETTFIGNVDLSDITERTIDKYKSKMSDSTYQHYIDGKITLDDVKKNISRIAFDKAVNYNLKKYNANLPTLRSAKEKEYQLYDITELRKMVQPIGR